VEIERLRESRSSGPGKPQSYGLERQVEPLVMASEISGLAALRGYLKLGNHVVRLHVPFIELPNRHPAFVERPLPASRLMTMPPVSPSSGPPAEEITRRDIPQGHERQTPPSGHTQETFFR